MPKILLVEDEKIISEPFGIILRAHSFDLDIATNGQEALDLCKKNSYDLILLDIMMPVLDGIGFLKKANLDKKSPKTKIVVLSNLAVGPEIEEALELGARRSLLKAQMTPASLIELVNTELKS